MSMKVISLLLLALCLLECVQSDWHPPPPPPLPPKLLASPDKELFDIGDTVILTCFSPYGGDIQYQFYFNDELEVQSSSHTWTRISLNPTDSGQYYCRIVYHGTSARSNYIEFTVTDGSCGLSEFGCCRDQTTPATGPNFQGCPREDGCIGTEHGCCPDGVTSAKGPAFLDCPDPICGLPPSQGPCNGQLERYFFSSFRTCQEFNYGGCPGNDNNFLTLDKCDRVCLKLDYSCEYGEKRYKHGESFTVDCNTCTCSQSVVTCTKKQCADSCPQSWLRYGDFCFSIDYSRRYTFGKALEKCRETPGASLVTPQTPEQNTQLKEVVDYLRPESFWIGMKAVYEWNDDTHLDLWSNWMRSRKLRLCVRANPKNGLIQWHPISCGVRSFALCQIPVKDTP